MDHARAPWPIAIEARGAASAGAVIWRRQGRSFVTVIAKATFTLVPERPLQLAAPQAIVTSDLHHDDDPRRSLRAASDLAPALPWVDVILTGHACAPPGASVQTSVVRLAIYRDDHGVLDKTLHVQGDRARDPNGRWFGVIPFQHLPLIYERATGSAEINPVGIDARAREPNLVHPRGWGLPACFGPIARSWPSRRRYAPSLDPRVIDPPLLNLPADLDDRFFQAAPEDQHLDGLRGDEWIVIDGMHPRLPRLRTRLPGARAVALVSGESPGSSRVVELRADTLTLDLDHDLCTITFRAAVPLASAQVLAGLQVSVEVEVPGVTRPVALAAPVAAQRSRPPEEAPAATAFAPSDLHADARPIMPFAKVTGSGPSPLARSSMAIDRGAASPARPTGVDFGQTMAVPGGAFVVPTDAIPFAPVKSAAPSIPPPPPAPPPLAPAGASRPGPSRPDLGQTMVAAGGEPASGPVAMPFAPVRSDAASPFAVAPTPASVPARATAGQTAYLPSDLAGAHPATPFDAPWAAPSPTRPPDSVAPFTAPLPASFAPATVPLPPEPPPLGTPAPAPPPLLITAAAAAPAEADAKVEGLGALFLDALPLPPEAPAKAARRGRDPRDEASAPRLR